MNKKSKNLVELHIATLILGSNGIFAKLIALPASQIIFWRSLIAAIAIGIYLLAKKKRIFLKEKRDYLIFVMLGIFVGIHWVTFFYSIQISNVAIGYLSLFTYPVMTAFLEPLLNHEKLEKRDILSALLVFVGVLVIVPELRISNIVTQGILWGVFSGLLYALRNIYCRASVKKYSGPLVMFYQFVITAVILLPSVSGNFELHFKSILLLLILGLVCTAFAHVLLANSLETLKAQTIGIVGSLQVAYSIIFAALLLSELPTIKTLIGGAIIMTAVFIEMKKRQQPEALEVHE